MTEVIQALISLLQGIIVWILSIGIFISVYLKSERLEREAIDNGFAHYNHKTRKFTWNSVADNENNPT